MLLLLFAGILRPCDQYPSEPGVLKPSSSVSSNSRPLSALSNGGVFMGNLRPKSEVDESEPDEEITNATTKVGTQTIFYVQPGLDLRGFWFLQKTVYLENLAS